MQPPFICLERKRRRFHARGSISAYRLTALKFGRRTLVGGGATALISRLIVRPTTRRVLAYTEPMSNSQVNNLQVSLAPRAFRSVTALYTGRLKWASGNFGGKTSCGGFYGSRTLDTAGFAPHCERLHSLRVRSMLIVCYGILAWQCCRSSSIAYSSGRKGVNLNLICITAQ